jgi:hypothetical protein
LSTPASESKKFIPNLSKHVLKDSEEAVLMKGFNFLVTNPLSNQEMACTVESTVSKLPQPLGIEFGWKIRSMLENTESSMPDMTKKVLKAVKSLRLNKDITTLQADKGNCMVVLDESKYEDKSNILLESGIYEPLPKDHTAKVERKVQKLLSKHKTALPADLKHKLTLYHSKPPCLYGLPKIDKPDIPLRPTVSSIGSSCYALAGFLHKILNPPAGKSESFIKNSGHSVKLLKSVNLQSLDTLVASKMLVFSLMYPSTNSNKSSEISSTTMTHGTAGSLRTTYFQMDDKFFQQKDDMAIGTSLSPIVSNIYMKHFETVALDSAQHKSSLWIQHVDDTFVVWPHGPEQLWNFLSHLNSLGPSFQFIMEIKSVQFLFWTFWSSGKR